MQTLAGEECAPAARPQRWMSRARVCGESLALIASPALAFFGLRLTLMAPPDLNDPAMHTTFILDPRDIFLRYTAVFEPTERLREAARVGFLVPGRIAYLVFGAVPGFIVYRYLLALIAVVPTYLLLRRMYGRAAGVVGVVIIVSCPVIILAWGTDFPDSAALSYLIGGLACLAMPATRHRLGWLIGAGVFFTFAIWALASSAPLIIVTLVTYSIIRRARDRAGLARDLAIIAGIAAAVTGVLVVASALLIGPFDYILTTFQSLIYLAQPSQEALNHSTSPLWAPYVTYLLVPLAVVSLWFVAFGRRLRDIPQPQLFVGLACASQVAVYAFLQFLGGVQVLEMHYFSSLLWSSVCLGLAITFVELGRPLLSHSIYRWVLPALLVAVPLLFELHPEVPQFGWVPFGLLIVALVVLLGRSAKGLGTVLPSLRSRLLVGSSLAGIAAGLLLLMVTPTQHPYVYATAGDPSPAYAYTLGGNDAVFIDLYAATTQLPGFVRPAAYSGEQLVQWWPHSQLAELREPIGIFHAYFDSIPSNFGILSSGGRRMIEQRRPAQVLLLSLTGQRFAEALRSLSQFEPKLIRAAVLRSGSVALHVWLIDLNEYYRSTQSAPP